MIPKPSVTIKQVASQAGVSTQTVSRVLNDRPDVSPETRARIKQVIAELGYTPNVIARSLSQGRTHSLGVVVHGLTYYGRAHTITGIERQAEALGYSLQLALLKRPEEENGEEILRNLLARQVDGVVWAVPEIAGNHAWLEPGRTFPVPVVFVNMRPRAGFVGVAVENRRGGYLAAQHLLETGRRRIGILTGPEDWWEAQQREAGWREALVEAGVSRPGVLREVGDWSAASGEVGLARLLERHPALDAVFASNDQMALGALQAVRRLGRRVPDDLAVVGFDDIPEAPYFCPPLTTVRQDLERMGARAVWLLCQMIETAAGREPVIVENHEWIEPELVIRASSLIQTTIPS